MVFHPTVIGDPSPSLRHTSVDVECDSEDLNLSSCTNTFTEA